MYTHLSTPPNPPARYTDVEVKLLISIARSITIAGAAKTLPNIAGAPEALLPEYVAVMMQKMVKECGYQIPTWNSQEYQWEIGNQTFKGV